MPALDSYCSKLDLMKCCINETDSPHTEHIKGQLMTHITPKQMEMPLRKKHVHRSKYV